jgi:hypothetical protein
MDVNPAYLLESQDAMIIDLARQLTVSQALVRQLAAQLEEISSGDHIDHDSRRSGPEGGGRDLRDVRVDGGDGGSEGDVCQERPD